MALDMLVDATQLDSALTSVADAIRAKGGTSGQLAFPAGFVSAVQAIPTGGGSGFPATLIKTLTVTENVNSFQFTYDAELAAYDVVFAMMDFELTASDWLYYSVGRVDETYGQSHLAHKYPIFIIKGDGARRAMWPNLGYKNISVGENIIIHTYASTKYIKTGSSIEIWGWNNADF